MSASNTDDVLAREALNELFPGMIENRKIVVRYSSKFKSMNANVRYSSIIIEFSLSRKWIEFSDDLRKGLFQHLFIKMFNLRDYEKTFSLDLYHKFLNNLEKYAKVDSVDKELEESYERINSAYFNGNIEKPNLKWGRRSFRKLGHFEYYTNTVLISLVFKGHPELTDYIMYHELLHKKHGGKATKTGRMIHHSSEFKKDEAKFLDKDAEKKLKFFLRKKKIFGLFSFE